MMLKDDSGQGYRQMQDVANAVIAKANQQEGLAGVYTFFDTGTPRVKTDIDRDKAQMLGVAPSDIFETLSVYLGSAFINDFNRAGGCELSRRRQRYRQSVCPVRQRGDGAAGIGCNRDRHHRPVPRQPL